MFFAIAMIIVTNCVPNQFFENFIDFSVIMAISVSVILIDIGNIVHSEHIFDRQVLNFCLPVCLGASFVVNIITQPFEIFSQRAVY
jgi:hypothetical protein